eukprot:4506786-Amphidinium_carterae.1
MFLWKYWIYVAFEYQKGLEFMANSCGSHSTLPGQTPYDFLVYGKLFYKSTVTFSQSYQND